MPSSEKNSASGRMLLVSPAFIHREDMSEEYSADGGNLSPPLAWSGGPANVEEYALICEDLDSTGEPNFVHWLMYRIPSSVHELPAGIPADDRRNPIEGALQGLNSRERLGYIGPSPRIFTGKHHYRFQLFALDGALRDLRPGMTREELFEKMKSHIMATTTLVGRYEQTRHGKVVRIA